MSGEPLGSTGDFQEALGALLGKNAPNLSPSVIARLRGEWEADYARWQRRDLSARRYVYIWADGIYLQARMEPTTDILHIVCALRRLFIHGTRWRGGHFRSRLFVAAKT